MNWEDEGFLIKKNKYSENANIINVFTSNHGKVSGIVYGGNSRKIKNFLQIGNKIHIVYNAKNPNKIGYFKTELITPISARFFNDKKRSSGIISVTSILLFKTISIFYFVFIFLTTNKLNLILK